MRHVYDQDLADYAEAAERAGVIPAGSADSIQQHLKEIRKERDEEYRRNPFAYRFVRSPLFPILIVIACAFIAAALINPSP